MGLTINFIPQQSGKQSNVYNSPFDRNHKNESVFAAAKDNLYAKETPKDEIFQIEDLMELDEFCNFSKEQLKPLQKYEGKPWSKEIFNETAAYFLDNIQKLKIDQNEEDFAQYVSVASLIDKLCFNAKDLTSENKTKIIQTADAYDWQLPQSFRKYLDENQKLYFDYLADDFERNGMDKFAKEVKEITNDGEIIYNEK